MTASATAPAQTQQAAEVADEPTLPGLTRDPVGDLLRWAIDDRASIHLIGPHGIGKTAYVTALVHQHGLRVVTKSLPVCTQRDFCVPIPTTLDAGDRAIDVLVLDELLEQEPGDRYVLILDELSRASSETLNTAMELLQEHTLAGHELPGLAAVVALDNPHDDPAYSGVNALDLAHADRVAALQVTAEDIPWQAHLEEAHGVDLGGFVREWARLRAVHRRTLCPRVVDHLLSLWRADCPVEWALPVHGAGREALHDGDTDVTEVVLDRLVGTLRSRTASSYDGGHHDAVDALHEGIERGWNVRLVGAPGIGKTSIVREAVARSGFDLEYLSLSQTSPSDLVVPVPVNGRLDFLAARRLVEPGRRYVLVLDEFSRANTDVAAAAMELVNERSLAGRKLDGCVAIIALDNPPAVGAITFDAGRIDAAQASRFTCTIEVTEDDLPWRERLLDQYGAVTRVFLDWRAEDLEDAVRALVSPRCIERMISLHAAGISPEVGLPLLGGERVPAPVTSLLRRLDGRGELGLLAYVTDVSRTLEQLADGSAEAEVGVVTALQRAEVTRLREWHEEVRALVLGLPPALRLSLVRTGGDRHGFFVEVLASLGGLDGHATEGGN